MSRRSLILFCGLFLLPLTVFPFEVRLEWEDQRITTGDLIRLALFLPQGLDLKDVQISMAVTNQDWEFLDHEKIGQNLHTLRLQCFALSDVTLWGLELSWNEGGERQSFKTPPCQFFVDSFETDETIRGLRGRPGGSRFLLVVTILAALLSLIGLGYWLRARKGRRQFNLPGEDEITDPWDLACARLAMLKQNPPNSLEETKEQIVLLTETLKKYLSARGGLSLVELTSRETLFSLKDLAWIKGQALNSLSAWLNQADLAKFAKQIPQMADFTRFFESLEDWLTSVENSYQLSLAEGEADDGIS